MDGPSYWMWFLCIVVVRGSIRRQGCNFMILRTCRLCRVEPSVYSIREDCSGSLVLYYRLSARSHISTFSWINFQPFVMVPLYIIGIFLSPLIIVIFFNLSMFGIVLNCLLINGGIGRDNYKSWSFLSGLALGWSYSWIVNTGLVGLGKIGL